MQFTAHEMKMIGCMRQQERRWPRTRWVLLGTAAFGFTICGYAAYFLIRTINSPTFTASDALVFAFLWPETLGISAVAGGLIAFAIRDWRGNVHRMLLLKLLETHHDEATQKDHPFA